MTIKAQLADGTPLEFPDGTPTSVMKAAVKKIIKQRQVQSLSNQMTGGATAIIPDIVNNILSSSVALPVGGIAGSGSAAINGVDQGVQTQQNVTDALTIDPRNELGQIGVDAVNKLSKVGIDTTNRALSGLVGLSALFTGQGLNEAANQQQDVVDKGFSEFAGNAALDAGLPPSVAAIIKALPAAVLTRMGFKQKIGIKPTTPKQLLADKVRKGSTDTDVVRLTTDQPRQVTDFEQQQQLQAPSQGVNGQQSILPQPTGLAVVKDKLAITAINQGFDEGIIAAIKQSSPETKIKLRKAADIKRKGINNRRFEADNRPSDVLGDSMVGRFELIRKTNKDAGKRIDLEANKLKGKRVDPTEMGDQYISDLNKLGVSLDPNTLKLNFKGSDIEYTPRARRILKNITKRLAEKRNPDAFDLHKIKRLIDEQVTYGRSKGGSIGKTENLLKGLRKNVDGFLDKRFPDYDKANNIYSESIGLLDEYQSIAGKNIDLVGESKGKGLGVLMRRTLGNDVSRDRIKNLVIKTDAFAKKNKGKFKDDLLDQAIFVNELDNRFGASAATSIKAQTDPNLRIPTKSDLVIKGGEKLLKRFKGVNNENAFLAIDELLKRK